MCLVLAYFAMFTDLLHRMTPNQRLVLTIILLAYSSFRIYRMVKLIRNEKSNKR